MGYVNKNILILLGERRMKYSFYAIFNKELDSSWLNIYFPDIKEAQSFGVDYEDAIKMATDLLKYALEINYNNCRNITPSSENEINKLYEYDDLVKIEVDVD